MKSPSTHRHATCIFDWKILVFYNSFFPFERPLKMLHGKAFLPKRLKLFSQVVDICRFERKISSSNFELPHLY